MALHSHSRAAAARIRGAQAKRRGRATSVAARRKISKKGGKFGRAISGSRKKK